MVEFGRGRLVLLAGRQVGDYRHLVKRFGRDDSGEHAGAVEVWSRVAVAAAPCLTSALAAGAPRSEVHGRLMSRAGAAHVDAGLDAGGLEVSIDVVLPSSPDLLHFARAGAPIREDPDLRTERRAIRGEGTVRYERVDVPVPRVAICRRCVDRPGHGRRVAMGERLAPGLGQGEALLGAE